MPKDGHANTVIMHRLRILSTTYKIRDEVFGTEKSLSL